MRPLILLTVVAGALGGLGAPAALEAAPPCTAPEHRQFDFWIGEWEVYEGGKLAGINSITREHGGCVIAEHWKGAKGFTGSSLNIYDASTRRWHQTWADASGLLLLLDGNFSDGAMRLASPGANADGVLDRVTWTPNADGTLRQLWEQSKDSGATWTVAFDGVYRRKARESGS